MLNVLEDDVMPFPLDLSSNYAMICANKLMLKYPKEICEHSHLIKCEEHLKNVLEISNFSKINWSLRHSIVTSTLKFLYLWLSKSFLSFAGTAHQLHRQNLWSSPIFRCCLIEVELDTLHVIALNHDLFMNFKRDLFVHLQQEVLMLTDEDITPLMLLEHML